MEDGDGRMPVGRKNTKNWSSTRSNDNFIALKAKMSGVQPRLSGSSEGFVQLGSISKPGQKVGRVWERIQKAADEGYRLMPDGADCELTSNTKRASSSSYATLREMKAQIEKGMRTQRELGFQRRYEQWEREQPGQRRDRMSNESPNNHSRHKNRQSNSPDEDDRSYDTDRDEYGNDNDTNQDGNGNYYAMDSNGGTNNYNTNTNGYGETSDNFYNQNEYADSQSSAYAGDGFSGAENQNTQNAFPALQSQDYFASGVQQAAVYDDDDEEDDVYSHGLLGSNGTGDSQPPTSQDIANICSGRFLGRGDVSHISRTGGPFPMQQAYHQSLQNGNGQYKYYDMLKNLPGRSNSRLDLQHHQNGPLSSVQGSNDHVTSRPVLDKRRRQRRYRVLSEGEVDDAADNGSQENGGNVPEGEYYDEETGSDEDNDQWNVSEDEYDQENAPEGQYDQEENIPEDEYDQENVPEGEYVQENVPEGQYDQENVPEDEYDQENAPEGQYDQENVPEDEYEKENEPEDHGMSQEDASEPDEEDEEEVYARMERERSKNNNERFKTVKEFFDDEAELSGSDDGDDEGNEDGVADDAWEAEAGQEDVPSEDELRSQIGRVHWKQMMDDDRRQLSRYKEAFVREENGRVDNYRFRRGRNDADNDDEGDFIDYGRDDDENEDEEEDEMDPQWQNSVRQRSLYFARHGVTVEENMAAAEDIWGNGEIFNSAKSAVQPSSHGVAAAVAATVNECDEEAGPSHSGLGSNVMRSESWLKRANGNLERLARNTDCSTRRRPAGLFVRVSPKKQGRNERNANDQLVHRQNLAKRHKTDSGRAKMISDVQFILDQQQQQQDQVTKESILQSDRKSKKPKKATDVMFKRPEGMNREVYNLLRRGSSDDTPLIPSVTSKMGGYKNLKARLGLRRARPWRWTPFTNPARNDNLQLCHWRRAEDEGREFQFARFNKVLETPSYTAEEYNKLLSDRRWSKEETDHLMELSGRFDLRWPVMLDRWDSSKFPTKRSIEDMKERYYFICNQLAVDRAPQGTTPQLIYFDVDNERRRKEQLNKLWNRTPEQVMEEEFLLQELRRIEARKQERERKARDLQKLISAAELAPPTPVSTALPSTAPKRKLPRTLSTPLGLADTGLETSSGLKFPEFRGPGVHLRSHRMKLPPTLGQKKVKAIEQALEKLGIEQHPATSEEIVTQFNDLRSDIILLYELKSALAGCEFELEALKHEYQALTGKELIIPSRLRMNSETDVADTTVTSPFKRRIADCIEVATGQGFPRKRKAALEHAAVVKKWKKM